MGFLSDNLSKIKPSPTIAVSNRAMELKREGRDIVSLGMGEPDFDPPQFVADAAIAAIQKGGNGYTAVDGMPELKDAVQLKFKRDNGLDYARDQITVNCGGKHTIYNAFMATLNPGDEVLIPAPYWVSYPDMAILAGGVPKFVSAGMETGFKITPAQLDAAITPKTKWLVFNSPSNPTGAAYTRDEIRALAEVLIRHPQVHIFSDDIYEHIVYDGFEFTTMAQVAPELYDRTLTMNGVAKGYAMTGWRIGFAGGPKDLIKGMAKVQSQSTSNPCTISQHATIAALTGPQDFLKERAAVFYQRRNLMVEKLNKIDGLSCPTPEGAFYVYPSIAELIGKSTPDGKVINNDLDFVTYLLEAEGVSAVNGEAFGLGPYFRASYAASTEQLEDACARIEKACANLR